MTKKSLVALCYVWAWLFVKLTSLYDMECLEPDSQSLYGPTGLGTDLVVSKVKSSEARRHPDEEVSYARTVTRLGAACPGAFPESQTNKEGSDWVC